MMFYCDECAEERGWTITISKSSGPCEICGYTRICNDTPSKHLVNGTEELQWMSDDISPIKDLIKIIGDVTE